MSLGGGGDRRRQLRPHRRRRRARGHLRVGRGRRDLRRRRGQRLGRRRRRRPRRRTTRSSPSARCRTSTACPAAAPRPPAGPTSTTRSPTTPTTARTSTSSRPGTCITATWMNGGYDTISGTSMAHRTSPAARRSTRPPTRRATPAQVQGGAAVRRHARLERHRRPGHGQGAPARRAATVLGQIGWNRTSGGLTASAVSPP